MRRPKVRRVATIDFCYTAEAKHLDIVAHQGARLRAIVDEERELRAARDPLDAKRAGTGKQVEHARIRNRIVVTVDQDIEQRLAQAVRRGAYVARGRRR